MIPALLSSFCSDPKKGKVGNITLGCLEGT